MSISPRFGHATLPRVIRTLPLTQTIRPGVLKIIKSRRRKRWIPLVSPLEARTLMTGVGTAPVVTVIQGPAPGTYGAGASLTFRVTYSEPVKASGAPSLPVRIGSTVQEAELSPVSNLRFSRTLVFRTTVPAGAVDDDGVELGAIDVRDNEVIRRMDGTGTIIGRDGDTADNVLPSPNRLERVRIDAVSPAVASFGFKGLSSGVVRAGGRIGLEVVFDEPVFVKGRPTVPFEVGGEARELSYVGGSGSRTLVFAYRTPSNVDASTVGFSTTQGEVLYLPPRATISDRRGNQPRVVRDSNGQSLQDGGRSLVVLGAHYQFLRRVGIDELKTILNIESREFGASSSPPDTYVYPDYVQPKYEVDLYKITYNSTIPEFGGRGTTATGLAAIPVASAEELTSSGFISRPLVSYQHGTVYGLKSVPSYAFTTSPSDSEYMDSYETRLAVAQFAGQGDVVIAADYFGMGDSIEPDSYIVKASEQQATLDLYRQTANLIRSQGVNTTRLLLSGWSQGGYVTMSFLQKLEESGIPVLAASTASGPADLLAITSAMLFNHRESDAVWLNTIFMIAAFSYETYYTKPGLAFDFFNPQYYEAARRIYTREYDHLGFDSETSDLLVYPSADSDPLRAPSDLTKLIQASYFDPAAVGPSAARYYPFSTLGTLLRNSGSYQWVIQTPLLLNYGTDDEAFSSEAILIPYEYQGVVSQSNAITPVKVVGGTHRGTFLTAIDNQRYWFNVLLGRDPGPKPPGLS